PALRPGRRPRRRAPGAPPAPRRAAAGRSGPWGAGSAPARRRCDRARPAARSRPLLGSPPLTSPILPGPLRAPVIGFCVAQPAEQRGVERLGPLLVREVPASRDQPPPVGRVHVPA